MVSHRLQLRSHSNKNQGNLQLATMVLIPLDILLHKEVLQWVTLLALLLMVLLVSVQLEKMSIDK
jgi:diacylglycerol kinase